MKILALDLGTVTGWATEKHSGTKDIPQGRGESPGLRFLRMRSWLMELIELAGPFDLIVYEQAHHRGGAATAVCVGFATEVQAIAAAEKIELMPVHTGSLKKWATGKGNANKLEMIQWARERRPDSFQEPYDDNEADAIALYHYAVEKLHA